MINATGNEVATVTQPEQNLAIGDEGNEAGAGAEAATLPPRQTPPPLTDRIREHQPMLLHTARDSSRQHKEMLQRH